MFIEQGIHSENKFWKYLIGSLIIAVASTVGQIPLVIAILIKVFTENKSFPTSENDLMTFLDSNLTLFLLMLSFAVALFAVYLVVKYIHRQTFLSVTTSRKKVDWSRVFFSFSLWAIFSIVSTLISYYTSPENFVFNFKPIPFLILFIIGVIMIPIQTSTEEYVFRGYLMQGFANLSQNKWFPLVMTSVIFGGMHYFNPEVGKMGDIIMIYYIGTGFMLGILTLMDEGMELALGFHAANNLIGALLVTTDWTVFQTDSILRDVSEPAAGLEIILPIFVVYPILLFVFSKKYNWTNWKEKLTGNIDTHVNEIHEIGENE
ncbi:MAG: CPBP family intramembrane glutamic endopeptidase [Bacteroidota bacterium]